MNAVRFLLLLLFAFTIQISFSQATEKWTLEKCIDYAIQNNITVRQAVLTEQTSRNQYRQSGFNLLPEVDVNASYNLNFGNSLNPTTYTYEKGNSQNAQLAMQGNLTLFNGLQQIYNIEKSRYDLLASKFDYENAKDNLSLNVASAYLQILLNKEIVGVAEKQKNLTEAQKAMTEKKVAAGALPESAIYEVDAQLSRDLANEVNDKGIYSLSVLSLKQLLQLPEQQSFDIDVPQVNADNQESLAELTSVGVYNYALSAQPSIKGAEARWKSADMSRKIAWGNITPTISAFFNLSTGYASDYGTPVITSVNPLQIGYEYAPLAQQLNDVFRQVAGVSIAVPIFGRVQRVTGIENARLQQQMRQLDLDNAKLQLRQTIEQAYENAQVAAENYTANKKSFESTTKSYEALEKRYESGLVTSYDLQQSKNQLTNAESQMIQAKYTYVFRMKILDFYQGKPITLN